VAQERNLQELEVGVDGPGEATRMFMVAGTATVQLFANAQVGDDPRHRLSARRGLAGLRPASRLRPGAWEQAENTPRRNEHRVVGCR
jgi:hypothetical protein